MAKEKSEQVKCIVELINFVSSTHGDISDMGGSVWSNTTLKLILSLPNGSSFVCDFPLEHDENNLLKHITWIDKSEEFSYALVTIKVTEKEYKGKLSYDITHNIDELYLKHSGI